ncbi:MAG: PilZ domain-containing protein [bacterium]|nr:PilZ domain-containing protein [bacterium]
MARIKRRRRVRCKLPCEILIDGKKTKRLPGRVVTLSEGGLAVLTGAHFDQGDAIRVLIDPKGASPIRVSAIVWNDSQAKTSHSETRLRRFGCVISSPSDSFVGLLERMLPNEAAPPRRVARDHTDTVPVPTPQPRDVEQESFEADLPRSRELQPPPKTEPEESLPYFRVRLKQIGGPRTRILTLQARSATQAEERAMQELASITDDAAGWGVLHIAKVV